MTALITDTPKTARRLIEPDYWTCPHGQHRTRPLEALTYGPEVAEFNASIGFAPDPQQELGLDLIHAVDSDGRPVSFETCVICCRQNLKTGLFKMAVTGWIYVLDVPLVVWSAHELNTALEAKRDLIALWSESPITARRLPDQRNQGSYDDNGSERIEVGRYDSPSKRQRVMFKARTRDGGRGLGAPKLVLDEAFALKAAMMGAIVPLVAAQEAYGPQILYGSSAGRSDSDALYDLRTRGRAGASPAMTYVEWAAPNEACRDERGAVDPECAHPKSAIADGLDCALDRERLILHANPTISTGRMSLATQRNLRQTLSPAEYLRECMGRWDEREGGAVAFGEGRWEAASIEHPTVLPAITALGISTSLDGEWGSLAVAREFGDAVLVGSADRARETTWLPAKVKRIQDLLHVPVVIPHNVPDSDLIAKLHAAEVQLTVLSELEWSAACSALRKAVRRLDAVHAHQRALDEAVEVAEWRVIGEKGRRGFKRAGSDGDIDALEAVACAHHGATAGINYAIEDSLL